MMCNMSETTPLSDRQKSGWNDKNSAEISVANNNNLVLNNKVQREKEREPIYYLDWS